VLGASDWWDGVAGVSMSSGDGTTRRVQVAVHRGTGLGAIAENTLGAVVAAARQGADIVEIDVVETSDGEFYLFHDGYEAEHFGDSTPLTSMSSVEVDALRYEHRLTGPQSYGPTRLREVLEHDALDVVLCLDRSWRWWPRLLPWLDEVVPPSRLQLKAPGSPDVLAQLAEHRVRYPFVAIARTPQDVERVMAARPRVDVHAVELVTATAEHPFADPGYVADLQSEGVLVWAYAITLENGRDLFCGWDDTVSVLDDPARGWQRLIDLGVDIIQTDWPDLLRDHLGGRA